MRTTTGALWALAGVGAIHLIVALVAVVFVPGEFGYLEGRVNMALSVLPFYGIALYLFVRRRRHLVARLLLTTGSALCVLTGLSGELALVARGGGGLPPLLWLQTLFLQWATFGFAAGLAATFVAFPDERVDDALRRWTLRALAGLTFVGPLLLSVSHRDLYLEPALLRPRPSGISPLFVEALEPLAPLATWLIETAPQLYVLGIVALLIRRDRGVTAVEQVQLRWMTAAGLLYGMFFVTTSVAVSAGVLSPGLNAAAPCLLFFPVAIAISVLRHQLLDVEVVIRKSLLYGALTLLIGLAIAGLAATLGMTVGARIPFGAAIAVTAVLMLALQPFRRRLEAAADRWVFGERLTGYQLLTRFGATLEHAYDLAELAPRLAAATVDGLGVRWARVEVCLTAVDEKILELLGAAGDVVDDDVVATTTVPLVHAGELVGVLSCGPKTEGPLTSDDRELLSTLGRQAALGIHNARLAAELAGRIDEIHRQAEELIASRTRIVQAQDTERRRIERNIHDGAQQEIVALIAKLRLARNQLARADGQADHTLAELQDDARTLLGDLRELAHGIHPPILTDRGLFEALDSRASRAELPITVHADPGLQVARFADDVEGAAFFFATEAMTNALKHARASRIDVTLARVDGGLVVDVEDDGVGFVPADGDQAGGNGLANIRDRVEALGGRLRIASALGGGARIRAELPVPLEVGHAAVLIAEDNYLVREGTRRLLEDGGEFEVVASLEDATTILDAVGAHRPDAVLTDIRMPPTHHTEGIDAALAVRARYPDVGVVVLSQHSDEAYAFELFKDGTAGLAYLLKERLGDLDELTRALREVVAGRSVIDPAVVEALVGRRARQQSSLLHRLTPREADVLRAMAEGKRNAAIGTQLSLSGSAIEKHVNAIFTKLDLGESPDVDRRVSAVLRFLQERDLR